MLFSELIIYIVYLYSDAELKLNGNRFGKSSQYIFEVSAYFQFSVDGLNYMLDV